MDQNELIANIVVLVVAVLAGLGGYFRSRKPSPPTENLSIITGGIVTRGDTERALNALETCAKSQVRMADALAQISDKRSIDMEEKLEELVEKIDHFTKRRGS